MALTVDTYDLIFQRQLNDSVLDTVATLTTLTPVHTPPPTPSPLLIPMGHTSLFQGMFVEPLAPPPPSAVCPGPPPEPPDPPPKPPDPPHNLWCICDPCIKKLTTY